MRETESLSGLVTQTVLSSGVTAMGPELVGPAGALCAEAADLRSSKCQHVKTPSTKSEQNESFRIFSFILCLSLKVLKKKEARLSGPLPSWFRLGNEFFFSSQRQSNDRRELKS
jgi:hypothetical protein